VETKHIRLSSHLEQKDAPKKEKNLILSRSTKEVTTYLSGILRLPSEVRESN